MCCDNNNYTLEEIGNKLDELLNVNKTEQNEEQVKTIKFDKTLLNQKTGNESVDNLMANMLGNEHLLELANDISNTLNNENINPLSLLTSMMSGKPDKKVQSLISNITGKLESKLTTGELNKDELQKNAEEFLSNGEMFNGIPFLGNLMKNMGNMGNMGNIGSMGNTKHASKHKKFK